jgi:flavin reductase (DIM6/NTAB) family NADH-FMN oxidoreductase RutF
MMLGVGMVRLAHPARDNGSPRQAALPEPASASFRTAMRQLAGGVSIVTTGAAPARTGFTATSVSSLSIDPPSLIVAIDRSSSAYAEIGRCGFFGVSMLAAHHEALAARFGGHGGLEGDARFSEQCWHTLATGASLLCDALAAVDCALDELIERHSHAIAIGRVVSAQARGIGDTLLYWRGDYHCLPQASDEQDAAQWEPILRSRTKGCG